MLKHFLAAGLGLLIGFTPAVRADTIVLKNGKRIKVEQTWKEDGQIKCERFGSVIGYPESMVDRVETDSTRREADTEELSRTYRSMVEDIQLLKQLSETNPPPAAGQVNVVAKKVQDKTSVFMSLVSGERPLDKESQEKNRHHTELAKRYLDKFSDEKAAGNTDKALKYNFTAIYHLSMCFKAAVDSIIRTKNLDILIINDL